MAGEIQLNSTTFATESGGAITVSNVDSATNRQNLGLEIGVDVQAFDTDTTKNDVANTFTANQTISVTDNTNAALSVTQLGTGNALIVNDEGSETTPFVIDASGNVGIGESSPNDVLNIKSTGSGGYNGLTINAAASGDTAGVIRIKSSSGTQHALISAYANTLILSADESAGLMRFRTNGGDRLQIDSSGNIGAPSGANIYSASDERLKQNITDLSGCLQKVLSMRGVSFNWIDEFCDAEASKTLYGLIAQELEIVDSNLVDSFSDNTITAGDVTVENPLRVNEKFIIPMLVESIKEQQSQIDALTARIEALEATP